MVELHHLLDTEKRELQATGESTSAGFQMLEAKVHTAITSEIDVCIRHYSAHQLANKPSKAVLDKTNRRPQRTSKTRITKTR
jgi:hypothetical protein